MYHIVLNVLHDTCTRNSSINFTVLHYTAHGYYDYTYKKVILNKSGIIASNTFITVQM